MKKNQRTVTFNHNPLLKRELPMWRPRFVLLALLAGSLTLTGRALYLQGVNNDFLQAKGESRYARTLEIPATRGRITDRHGDMLVSAPPCARCGPCPRMPSSSRRRRVSWRACSKWR